jgi:hypothetical protein
VIGCSVVQWNAAVIGDFLVLPDALLLEGLGARREVVEWQRVYRHRRDAAHRLCGRVSFFNSNCIKAQAHGQGQARVARPRDRDRAGGDYTDTVGLRNSHDKSFPIGTAFGSRLISWP